jgi:L-fuculose-phosphate aldolase
VPPVPDLPPDLPMDRDVHVAQEQVHETCQRMVADRLVVGSAGNVSVRVGSHHAVVSAGGVEYRRLRAVDHPLIDLRAGGAVGTPAAPDARRPTSELALHLAVLRSMPDVGAVVHTHSPFATGFAVARVPLEFVCNENIGPRSERILVTEPYAPPGSSDLADAVVETLRRQPGSRACLLANHGPVAIADDVDTAFTVAAQVEWIAQVTHVARGAGSVHVLDRAAQRAIASTYGFTVATDSE